MLLFDRFGNQPDLVSAGAFRNIDQYSYILKRQGRIALDKHNVLIAILENILKTLAEVVNSHRLLIDADFPAGINRHDNRPLKDVLVLFLVLVRLGNKRVQTLRALGRDGHEDNQ